MRIFDLTGSNMLLEAKKATLKPKWYIQMLLFVAVFTVVQGISSIPTYIVMMPRLVKTVLKDITETGSTVIDIDSIYQKTMDMMSDNVYMLILLFSTVLLIIPVIIYCVKIEKRSLASMGFVKKNWLSRYITGAIAGFVLFGLVMAVCCLAGTSRYVSFNKNVSYIMLLVYFAGYVLQGASEEILLRGYFMISLTNSKVPVIAAVFINSSVFSLLHLANSGFTLLAAINILLFGVFASMYMLRTDDIWGVCAIHTVWNFVQGSVYSQAVSGIPSSNSLFIFEQTGSGVFAGGEFGPEGSLATTIVLVPTIACVLLLVKNRYAPVRSESIEKVK